MKNSKGSARRLLAALLLLAPPAAADSYVDAVNGSDANGGTSWSDAWRTLTHATTHMTDWSAIHVAPGVHDAALGELFPLQLGANPILGAGAGATVIDGGGAPVLMQTEWGRLSGVTLRDAEVGISIGPVWGSAEVRLEEVTIAEMSGYGVRGEVYGIWPCELLLRLERCRLSDCGVGAWLHAEAVVGDQDWTDAVIEALDTRVERCGTGLAAGSGEDVESTGTVETTRCVLAFNAVGVGAEAASIRSTTVFGNTSWGLSVDYLGLRDSVVHGNAQQIFNWGTMNVTYSCIQDWSGGGAGNISDDPLFVDAPNGDFRLRFESPCVDAGFPVELPEHVDGDLDAHERLDMGAFELEPLTQRGRARVGRSFALELLGPGGDALVYFSPGPRATPPAATAFGELDLVRARMTLFGRAPTAPWPPGVLPIAVPDDPQLVGRRYTFQALAPSTVTSPPLAWTNPVTVTIEP